MIILGIDPALRTTGYGLIECGGNKFKLIEAGVIQPKVTDLFEHRILKVYSIIQELINEFHPDVLVLEKIYAHHNHPATASILGHVRGVICLIAAQKKLKLAELPVKRVRKSIVGEGGASKEQTRRVVSHLLKVDELKLTLDASDALALALGYHHLMGRGL